jgi:hypothetical protein
MKPTEFRASGAIANSISANTLFLITTQPDTDPQTKVITGSSLANSFNQPGSTGIPLMPNTTPANSTIAVKRGVMFHDNNYIYIATADNVLKRVAISAF